MNLDLIMADDKKAGDLTTVVDEGDNTDEQSPYPTHLREVRFKSVDHSK